MSDELIKSLNARITELETRYAGVKVALRNERNDHRAVKAELDDLLTRADGEFKAADAEKATLAAELEAFKAKAEATPNELQAEVDRLKGEIRTRDHRSAWEKALAGELHEKASVDDVWGKVGYRPDADAVDPATISELVGKAKDAAPYLFAQPAAPGNGAAPQGASQGHARPPLRVAAEAGRGARDTAPALTYRKTDLQAPGWMTKNPELAKAIAAGDATLVE